MDVALPLAVVVPLLAAAAISGLNPLFGKRRRVLDAVAILTATGVTGLLVTIMLSTVDGQRVYWFAGFTPSHGIALGIDFAVDQLNSGLAALNALLVTASLVFCLPGDVFNLFVWFEVMGVAAYALTAYRPEERGPIQGALNFAITNSVGAYFSLSGIALIYGRTGALNMAQIGQAIAGHRPDGLVWPSSSS